MRLMSAKPDMRSVTGRNGYASFLAAVASLFSELLKRGQGFAGKAMNILRQRPQRFRCADGEKFTGNANAFQRTGILCLIDLADGPAVCNRLDVAAVPA
jgi:hypothetical protein